MDIATLDPGLLVVGSVGIIIIVAAYFVGKILAKRNKSGNDKQVSDKPVDKVKAEDIKQPEWKEKRSFLQRIRNRKKQQDIHEQPAAVMVGSKPLEASIPVTSETKPVHNKTEQAPVTAPVVETTPVPELTPPSVTAEPAEQENPKPEKKEDPMADLFADLADKPEDVKPVMEMVEEKEEKKPEKSGSADDIFSMFTDEDEEEDEKTKFARSLSQVSIDDLLGEVRDIRKYMRN